MSEQEWTIEFEQANEYSVAMGTNRLPKRFNKIEAENIANWLNQACSEVRTQLAQERERAERAERAYRVMDLVQTKAAHLMVQAESALAEKEREMAAAKSSLSGRTVSCSNCNTTAKSLAAKTADVERLVQMLAWAQAYAEHSCPHVAPDCRCEEIEKALSAEPAALLAEREREIEAKAWEEAGRLIFKTEPPKVFDKGRGTFGGWLTGVYQFKELLFAQAAALRSGAGRKP